MPDIADLLVDYETGMLSEEECEALEDSGMLDGFEMLGAEVEARLRRGKQSTCIKCGCTDENCRQCITAQGYPCRWVAPGKCSCCFGEDGTELEARHHKARPARGPAKRARRQRRKQKKEAARHKVKT